MPKAALIPTTSRRGVLASAVSLAAGALPAHPDDARLLALAGQYWALHARMDAVLTSGAFPSIAAQDEASYALCDEAAERAEAMLAIPSRSLSALGVKARVAESFTPLDTPYPSGILSDRLLHGVLADLLRITA